MDEEKRRFLKMILAGGAGAILGSARAQQHTALPAKNRHPYLDQRFLPPMQVNAHSSEAVLNSRRSYHSGYHGILSEQIVANTLWAAARAPLIGAWRTIYIALPDKVYQYDPSQHSLSVHKNGNQLSESVLAFEIGVAADLIEDAGVSLHYAHLASTAFWSTTTQQPCCCPKESGRNFANSAWNPSDSIHMVNCYGLLGTVSGITTQLVANSSDASLPDPSTDGPLLLEQALDTLDYGTQFVGTELDLNQLGQIAWASYGCNPHYAFNGYAALTAASSVARYFLTGRIYIVRSQGVERYHVRQPSGVQSTRDHRIERVTNGDQRPGLRAALPRLPQTAPNYFVFCADGHDRARRLEAGYCGASALLQATSIGLKSHCTAGLTSSEQSAVINALSLPAAHEPLLVFSVGPR